MDAFTAGSVLIVSKFSVAVIMTCIYCLIPREKCTLDWALAAALVACGAAISIANAGAPRYEVLIAGNGAIIVGMVMQWRGVRSFYQKPAGFLGWIICAIFLVLYVWMILTDAPITRRAVLLSATILSLLILNAIEFAAGYRAQKTLGSLMAVASSSFLVLCYVVSVALSASGMVALSHSPDSALAIALIYLLPIAGSLALTTSMIVLLGERHAVAPTETSRAFTLPPSDRE
jgi:hypothetical protein